MTQAAPHVLDPQVEVLQGLCHAFGSSDDLFEMSSTAVRWIQAAVGNDASVRISLADQAGRLRTVAESGTLARGGGKRSTRRREAFESKIPSVIGRERGTVLAVLPLVCRDEPCGVLEVVGSRQLMVEREGTLGAVASQLAMAVRNLRDREDLERQVDALTSAADLVRELVRAETLEAATLSALKLSSRVARTPAAAWVAEGDEPQLCFLGIRGATTRKCEELRMDLPTIRRWESAGPRERSRVAEGFRQVMEVATVTVIDGGEAVILVGGSRDSAGASLGVVGSLFQKVLRNLSTVARAERRNEQLDLSIAWTAHEVRGPLLAAKAAIDQLLMSNGSLAGDDLLSRSGRELADLATLVDALMRWAVGIGRLQRRPVNLARVVRRAIETCRLECTDARLVLHAPEQVPVRGDPKQLRSAVSNVVRNALVYSPAGSEVTVNVSQTDGMATVSVSDQGPGIGAGEKESIFDPFVRGRSGNGRGDGHGLGLFIARRVVEAHGGTIWVESGNGRGARFRIRFPVNGNGHGRASGNGQRHARADGGGNHARTDR